MNFDLYSILVSDILWGRISCYDVNKDCYVCIDVAEGAPTETVEKFYQFAIHAMCMSGIIMLKDGTWMSCDTDEWTRNRVPSYGRAEQTYIDKRLAAAI